MLFRSAGMTYGEIAELIALVGLPDLDHALRMVGGQSQERSIHITVEPWKS